MTEAASATDTELTETELLKIENERLKIEIQALHAKDQNLKSLADDVKSKTEHWERCKEQAKDAGDERIASMEALAAAARGDVQTDLFDGDEKEEMIDFGAKKRPQTLNAGNDHMKVAGTFRAMQFALTLDDLNKCDASHLIQIEPEVGKRKVGAVKALDGLYVPAYQHCYEDGSGYVNAWPLIDPVEWGQRLAETYGPALFDMTEGDNEGEEKRKTGGEYNGVVVKCGRKKYVVGPDAEVVRLIYGPDGRYAEEGCIAAQLMEAK